MDFLVNSGLDFVSVDITNDQVKMKHTWDIEIPEDHYIDLQDLMHFEEKEGGKTGMAQMATAYIHQRYEEMKTKFKKSNHAKWGKCPLDSTNLHYAAIDAYVAFELFRIYTSDPPKLDDESSEVST